MPVEEITFINGENQEQHAISYFDDDICKSELYFGIADYGTLIKGIARFVFDVIIDKCFIDRPAALMMMRGHLLNL